MLNKKYKNQQLYLLVNQLCVVLYLAYEYLYGNEIKFTETIQMVIITFILIEVVYIGKANYKFNILINQYLKLLILVSWYFLLSLDNSTHFFYLLIVMLPITLYFFIKFLLIFFFQDSSYKYKKITDSILIFNCIINLLCVFINGYIFNLLFMYQFLCTVSICLFLFITHRKRILFVLRNGWKSLHHSLTAIISIFCIYIYFFREQSEYIDNIGTYILIVSFLIIIHCITFSKGIDKRLSTLNKKNKLFITLGIIFMCITNLTVLKPPMVVIFFLGHSVLVCIIILNYIIFSEYQENNSNKPQIKEYYTMLLKQIKREENLKKDFSNFLHDSILQDLLSVKNMISKLENENMKQFISQTLYKLSSLIRDQMNTYHPQLLRSLTLKENLQSLIDTMKEFYPNNPVDISFECEDKFFLVEPYNIIIYRILKELLTNAMKHSKCSMIEIYIFNKREDIILIVNDDGIGIRNKQPNEKLHSGLYSIQEQVKFMNGEIRIKSENKSGTKITIIFPMKGEDSYTYLINR